MPGCALPVCIPGMGAAVPAAALAVLLGCSAAAAALVAARAAPPVRRPAILSVPLSRLVRRLRRWTLCCMPRLVCRWLAWMRRGGLRRGGSCQLRGRPGLLSCCRLWLLILCRRRLCRRAGRSSASTDCCCCWNGQLGRGRARCSRLDGAGHRLLECGAWPLLGCARGRRLLHDHKAQQLAPQVGQRSQMFCQVLLLGLQGLRRA